MDAFGSVFRLAASVWILRPLARVREALPRGRTLPAPTWRARHRGVLVLLAAHAMALPLLGLQQGLPLLHVLWEGALLAGVAALAAWPSIPQRARSVVASFGLMTSSALLVHFSGGYIEAHFHFFVMLGVILLYEDWLPFLLSIAYVAIHHGVVGTLDPQSVFNHPGAIAQPWTWALVHAFFILGLSAALIVTWNVSERARRGESIAQREARGLRQQLGAHEKMAALGSLASGLAHEVRTPLTIVAVNASIIERRLDRLGPAVAPKDASLLLDSVREIHASVDRMNQLVLQLRRYARLDQEARVAAPLAGPVQEALGLFRVARQGAVRIEEDLGDTPPVAHHPLGIQQVVLNLVSNAVEASDPATGVVRVATRTVDGRACLVVEDEGRGMTEEVRARIFEPLFTTKPDGTGLGLAIVRRIVAQHGASVECDSRPGKGSRFTVTFPPATEPREIAVTTGSPAPLARA